MIIHYEPSNKDMKLFTCCDEIEQELMCVYCQEKMGCYYCDFDTDIKHDCKEVK